MDIVGGIELVKQVIKPWKYHHYIGIRVETGSGHPGQVKRVSSELLSRLSVSDPVGLYN